MITKNKITDVLEKKKSTGNLSVGKKTRKILGRSKMLLCRRYHEELRIKTMKLFIVINSLPRFVRHFRHFESAIS